MKKHYHHLSHEDRIIIYEYLYQGYSIQEIAIVTGYHKTTIYRELHRNSGETGYKPNKAEHSYQLRKQYRLTKLDRNSELKSFVIEKLESGWSPELIDGYLRRQAGRCVISYETIYRFIYSAAGLKLKLYQYLMQKRRFRYPRIKRRRKTILKDRKKSIHNRHPSINARTRYGHWEGDLILFHHTQANLITLRERKSRLIIAIKNASRHATTTTDSLVRYLNKRSLKTIKTLTLDNGVEFSYHEKMSEKLKAIIYFCDPYKSWQKGAIENANKLLRTKLPRKINIDSMEQNQIDNIVKQFNDRPMKCLNFQTPNEVFKQTFGLLPV